MKDLNLISILMTKQRKPIHPVLFVCCKKRSRKNDPFWAIFTFISVQFTFHSSKIPGSPTVNDLFPDGVGGGCADFPDDTLRGLLVTNRPQKIGAL